MGAWIETSAQNGVPMAVESRPTWARGLKHSLRSNDYTPPGVAPHVGAWIETPKKQVERLKAGGVAPHVGAWIETSGNSIER